jgi:hypothetical protein
LIRRDQEERQHLRGLFLDGAATKPTSPASNAYFDGLRKRAARQQVRAKPLLAARQDSVTANADHSACDELGILGQPNGALASIGFVIFL